MHNSYNQKPKKIGPCGVSFLMGNCNSIVTDIYNKYTLAKGNMQLCILNPYAFTWMHATTNAYFALLGSFFYGKVG